MGDRAVVRINGAPCGVYLHLDGSIERVDALTTYCRLRGIRCDDDPSYGMARLAWVAGCWTGADTGLSVGMCGYDEDPGDNGVYTVDVDWRITEWTRARKSKRGTVWDEVPYSSHSEGTSIVAHDRERVRRLVRDIDGRMPEDVRLATMVGREFGQWLDGRMEDDALSRAFERECEYQERLRLDMRIAANMERERAARGGDGE